MATEGSDWFRSAIPLAGSCYPWQQRDQISSSAYSQGTAKHSLMMEAVIPDISGHFSHKVP